jgi:hypothetical protein
MTLSRMGLGLVLLIPASAHADPMARYEAMTQVVVHRCTRPSGSNEILVCGRRAADKWRVPLIQYDAGDPRAETVSGERNRIASAPRLKCGVGAILAGCGAVGVSVSTNGQSAPKLRTLAD